MDLCHSHSHCHWFFLLHLHVVDSWWNSMLQEAEKKLMKKVSLKYAKAIICSSKVNNLFFASSFNSRIIVPQHEFTRSFPNILISCWFWLQLLVIIALLVAIRVPQEQPFWKQSKFCLKVRLTFTRNGVICSKILVLQNSLTNLPNFVINDCGWKKLEGFKRKNRWLLICKYYLLPRLYHVSLH